MDIQGKRCRVFFENINRYSITRDYHYPFRNAILEKLGKSDPVMASNLHDRWNEFWGFSSFLGRQWNTPLGLQFRQIEVDFSSPDQRILSNIRNSLLIDPFLTIGGCKLKVTRTEMEHIILPGQNANVKLETLGEIVIKKPSRDGKTLHVGADDDVPMNLKDIIERQYSAYSGKKEEVNINIEYVKQKKKAIVKNDEVTNSFLALRLRFSMVASPDLIEFVLTQGIGHHRKMGFGMVRLKELEE